MNMKDPHARRVLALYYGPCSCGRRDGARRNLWALKGQGPCDNCLDVEHMALGMNDGHTTLWVSPAKLQAFLARIPVRDRRSIASKWFFATGRLPNILRPIELVEGP